MHADLSNNRMERFEFRIFRNLNRTRIHQAEEVSLVIGQDMIEKSLFAIVTRNLEDWQIWVHITSGVPGFVSVPGFITSPRARV